MTARCVCGVVDKPDGVAVVHRHEEYIVFSHVRCLALEGQHGITRLLVEGGDGRRVPVDVDIV